MLSIITVHKKTEHSVKPPVTYPQYGAVQLAENSPASNSNPKTVIFAADPRELTTVQHMLACGQCQVL